MSIEQLKKKLESEREDESYNYEYKEHRNCYGCCQSSSDYEKAFQAGHEAATNRLLPLLERAVEVIKIYGEELEWDGVNNPAYIQDRGKIARKFLAEINKEFGE